MWTMIRHAEYARGVMGVRKRLIYTTTHIR